MPGSVIVVEDDASVSAALARILRLGGLQPETFPSAEALLAGPAPATAVCLVLDVQLPGMSGFELRERLATSQAMPPVIFISAFDEPSARAKAAAAGALFLAKPFAGRALLEAIEQATRTSSPGH